MSRSIGKVLIRDVRVFQAYPDVVQKYGDYAIQPVLEILLVDKPGLVLEIASKLELESIANRTLQYIDIWNCHPKGLRLMESLDLRERVRISRDFLALSILDAE